MTAIFPLPVFDKWLVHAPLAGISALVNSQAASALRSGAAGLPPELAEMRSGGKPEPRARTGPLNPLFLGLLPTRACNMGCLYCGFGASSADGAAMRPEIAVRAIDWAAGAAAERGAGVLEVHLFGGEPLLPMDLVDVIVHRTRAAAAQRGLTPRLETATNATCDEAFARFVGDYFDAVIVSFDGLPDVQNHCRPLKGGIPSFERVRRNTAIWSRSPAKLCIRICVTRDNVAALPETAEWFAREFEPAVVDCETVQCTPESEGAGLSPPDPLEFARAFWEARTRCEPAGVEVHYGAASPDALRVTFCPVGQDAVIVSPDGRVSACYMERRDWRAKGLDLDFGCVADDGVRLDWEALSAIRELAQPRARCEGCFCRWSCAGGCHVTHNYPGCPDTFSGQCIQTRLITACRLLAEMDLPELARKLLGDASACTRLAQYRGTGVAPERRRSP